MAKPNHTLIDKSLMLVRAYLSSPGVTKLGFAAAAGLSDSMLRDAHSEEWNPTARTLRALERAIPPDFELRGRGKGRT